MEKVSIIVPVYNSEEYIGKCMESILNQTYQNIELLVVNDGSKDNSWNIIKEFQDKFPDKITAFNQKNKGVALTRNESIKKAKGKYIMFVDNDDFLNKDYIETFVKEIESEDYDVVIGGYRRPNEYNKIIKKMKLKNTEWSKFMIMAPWAKIYKKDYIIKNNIEFLNVNIGEDVYFNLKAMLISDKVKIIDYVGYNWYYNKKSISNSKQKNIQNLQVFELLNSCYDMLMKTELLKRKYKIIETYFTRYIVWLLFFSTKNLDYKTIDIEYDKLFKWMNERFPDYKKNKMISYTKPKGEIASVKFITKTLMNFHKMRLGKFIVYIYSNL